MSDHIIVLSDSNESRLSSECDEALKNTNENEEDFDFPQVHFNRFAHVSNQGSKLPDDERKGRSCSDSTDESNEETKKRKKGKTVKTAAKNTKDRLREEKLERQKELLRKKALKKIELRKSRNIRPGECIKFVEVVLDKGIENFNFLSDIVRTFFDANIQYSIDTELIPNSVTWKRIVEDGYVNESNEICATTNVERVDRTLIIWNWDEAVAKVADGSFCATISQMKTLLPNNHFLLLVYGMENYFARKSGAKNKTQKSSANWKVSRREFEACLNQIQIVDRCNSKLVDDSEDLALTVYQCTKAVAEAPYKAKKNDELTNRFDWYVTGDNKNTVRIDKDGNGLRRLWQQQLCQFNLSSLEIAEAICSVYSSPAHLMEAYKECSRDEGTNLLKDIPIRRAAGPLTATRKVGPELSKKIYTMFTSRDGECLLN